MPWHLLDALTQPLLHYGDHAHGDHDALLGGLASGHHDDAAHHVGSATIGQQYDHGHDYGHSSFLASPAAAVLTTKKAKVFDEFLPGVSRDGLAASSASEGLGIHHQTSQKALASAFLERSHTNTKVGLRGFEDRLEHTGQEVVGGMATLASIGRRSGQAAYTSFLFGSDKGLTELVASTPPSALVPLHAASIVFALPGHILFELGEGYIFGLKKGLVLAFCGKSLGSLAAFGAARVAVTMTGLKDSLETKMQEWPLAVKVASAVEQGGMFSVFLLTVAPVPCVVKNYTIPILTGMPFATYAPGKLLGLLPTTAAHVYAGTLAPSLTELSSGAAMKTIGTFGAVGAGTVALGVAASYLLHEQYESSKEEENTKRKPLPKAPQEPQAAY